MGINDHLERLLTDSYLAKTWQNHYFSMRSPASRWLFTPGYGLCCRAPITWYIQNLPKDFWVSLRKMQITGEILTMIFSLKMEKNLKKWQNFDGRFKNTTSCTHRHPPHQSRFKLLGSKAIFWYKSRRLKARMQEDYSLHKIWTIVEMLLWV